MGVIFRWVLHIVVYLLMSMTVIWAVVAFCSGSVNVMEWSAGGRTSMLIISSIASVVLTCLTHDIEVDRKLRGSYEPD